MSLMTGCDDLIDGMENTDAVAGECSSAYPIIDPQS